jgi:hypothetical protein
MKKLYKQIINGIEYTVNLASLEEIKKEMTGSIESEEEYYGYHYSRKRQIVIADDLDGEQATRSYIHEYIHAHRFSNGYDIQKDKLNEESLCDYVMANYYTFYHMAEHFSKHYIKHIAKESEQ